MPPPLKRLTIALAILLLCFSWPIYKLARFSFESSLYSYILLIPFISAYLIWLSRDKISIKVNLDSTPAKFFALAATAVIISYGWLSLLRFPLTTVDSLFLPTASLVLFFWSICSFSLSTATSKQLAFPLGFLLFTLPLPSFATELIEYFLQHGSAYVALGLFKISGTPVFNDDLIFQLPGMSLKVAPECSGIHSTLALLITSLLAGYLFLRSTANRLILAIAVIPLALLRNGFRVFVIGELCVHISPEMINSYIHRQGGPVFFALSLLPFSFLLLLLIKLEKGRIFKAVSQG